MDAAQMSLWRRLYYTRLRDAVRGRFDASLDREKIVADSGLPMEVVDVVMQVIRRSKLWRSEQVDVAKELVAHFQDGLAAGQSPQQLIASFGDLASAAQLIRYAKKRGRPIVWQLWHYGSITIAALIGLYLLAGLYLILGRPSIKTDYLAIINQRAASVPEDKRAWPLYREALTELGAQMNRPTDGTTPFFVACDARPGDTDWPQAQQFMVDHQSSIAKLRSATEQKDLGFLVWTSGKSFAPKDRPLFSNNREAADESKPAQYDNPEDNMLMTILLPHLQLLRWSAELLASDCRRAASAGDGEMALADVNAIVGISRHCEEAPLFVNTMVAMAIQNISFATVHDTLAKHPDLWSDAQLQTLAHTIAVADIDWRRGLEGERASFRDVIQRLYTDDGHDNGRITAEGLRRLDEYFNSWDIDKVSGLRDWRMRLGNLAVAAVAPSSLFFMASRRAVVDKYDQLMDQEKARIESPLWMSREGGDSLANWSATDRLRFLPLSIMLPTLENVPLGIETHAGTRDGVLIGIALELYHRKYGKWPASLAELSPRWLPSLPLDRITGEPLHYKIVGDRPVVYSVGADLDDDGGQVPLEDTGTPNTILAAPVNMIGTPIDGDWVIWSTVPGKDQGATDN